MKEIKEVTSETIKILVQNKEWEKIKEISLEEHPVDFSSYLELLSVEETAQVMELMTLERQSKVLAYFSESFIPQYLECVGVQKFAEILNVMSSDDRVDLLQLFEQPLYDDIFHAMAKAEREDIRKLAAYDDESVGSIMTTDYSTLTLGMTVDEALHKLRREAREVETINRTYVVDKDRKILGMVKLERLILADRNKLIEEVMQEETMSIPLRESPEYAAKQISKYDVVALPVVDDNQRLCGIVTYDDALDILEEEATEDFHQHASIGKISGDILSAGWWLLYKKRIGWLVLLVFGNIFSGAGIAYFEETIETYVALVFFLPLLIDSGGNAGSQSSTLMVRALATGEVVLKDWSRMMGREICIALLLGVTMAFAVSFLGFFRGGPQIAMVVSMTMVLTVLVGSVVGMGLPFILSKFNLDPATASAPLITSIADASGVIIYFTIATAVLPTIA